MPVEALHKQKKKGINMDKTIYCCHNHLFTDKHIPNRFFTLLGVPLVPVARNKVMRIVMRGAMKAVVPFTKNDTAHRYAAFIKAAYRKTQEDNLKHLIDYYPEGKTRFVILPMDLSCMGAGKVPVSIDLQHEELAALTKDPRYKDILIPFAHIDPRAENALERLKKLVEEDGFRGVKIYPPLGYRPDHPILMNEIYPYMVEKNIPLITHCSPGVVNSHDLPKKDAQQLADPAHYETVMRSYPQLKICLAHFGGISEWQRHIYEPRSRRQENPTWLSKILKMMRSGNYPNLYADISYTVFNIKDHLPLLKILLEDPMVQEKVLFGSDFYMVEAERFPEKKLSLKLRSELGAEMFWKIANENPMIYLGETPDADQLISRVRMDEEVSIN